VETFAIIEQQAASRKEKTTRRDSRGNDKARQGCSSSIFNQIRLLLESLLSLGV
jgi:hypothetical protein